MDKVNSIIIQEDFTGSTYDWSTPPNGGSITSANDEFNVTLKNKWNSTNKYVTFTPGKTIHIEFDFENVDMDAPRFFVRERVNGVWEPNGQRDRILLDSDGHYVLDLNLVGDYIRIYFEKGNSGDDGTLTSFKIDNLVITQNIIDIVEEDNYYPFGLKHKGYNDVVSSSNIALKRKFGGKEYQDELNLAWYDVSARNYDPALGRWMNLDPLAEKMRKHSPYNYAFDNPIYWIDYDGMAPTGAGDEPREYNGTDDVAIGNDVVNVLPEVCIGCQISEPIIDIPWLNEDYAPFVPSQSTTDLFDEGKELLSNIFSGDIKAEVSHGSSFNFQLGPAKAGIDVDVFVGSVSVDEEKINLTGRIGQAKGKFTFGNEKDPLYGAQGGFYLSEFQASARLEDLSYEGSISGGEFDDLYIISRDGFLNADESFSIGLGGKLGPVKAKGSINFYNLGKGVGKVLQGVGSWVSDYVAHQLGD